MPMSTRLSVPLPPCTLPPSTEPVSRLSVWVAPPLNWIASPPSVLSIVPALVIEPGAREAYAGIVSRCCSVVKAVIVPSFVSEPPASNWIAEPPDCAFEASR